MTHILRLDEMNEPRSTHNPETKEEIMGKVVRMWNKAGGKPFTFEVGLREAKPNTKTEEMTFCACTRKDHDRISQDPSIDDEIFFYILSPEDLNGFFEGKEDFEILYVLEDTFAILDE